MRRSQYNTGRWMKEEHEAFLRGAALYHKDWKLIATVCTTRTVLQIRTHGQKYYDKIERGQVFPREPYPSMYDVSPSMGPASTISPPPSLIAGGISGGTLDDAAPPPTDGAPHEVPTSRGAGGYGGGSAHTPAGDRGQGQERDQEQRIVYAGSGGIRCLGSSEAGSGGDGGGDDGVIVGGARPVSISSDSSSASSSSSDSLLPLQWYSAQRLRQWQQQQYMQQMQQQNNMHQLLNIQQQHLHQGRHYPQGFSDGLVRQPEVQDPPLLPEGVEPFADWQGMHGLHRESADAIVFDDDLPLRFMMEGNIFEAL